MPKVTTVKKACKDQGPCTKCGTEIRAGEGYLYWAFMINGRGGPSIKRCTKPECRPTQADLTSSEFLRTLYQIQEHKWEGGTVDDLESERDDVVQELEDLKSETEDKLQNMPEGLQQGSTGELLQERIDALESGIDELGSVDTAWDRPDEKNEGESDEAFAKRKEESLAERVQEIKDELEAALGNVSCS